MSERKAGWYYADYGYGWTCDYYDGDTWAAMDEMVPGRAEGLFPLCVGDRIPMPDEKRQEPPVSTRGY